MSEAKVASVPLYSPQSNRDESILKDSRLINGMVESGQGPNGDEVWVYKRPGILFQSAPAGGDATGLGVFNWQGDIFSIFNTTLYKNGVSVGTVNSGSSYTFTSCLGATPKLFLKNLSNAYVYDSGGGLVAVSDGDYPSGTMRGCVYLDGTTYVLAGFSDVHGSGFNDPTSWDPLNVILAQIEPDAPKCIVKQLVYVVVLKSISTEVFYDAGNGTGSPLGPVQGSKLGVGARAATSVVRCGDDIAWVGTTAEGASQVMFMSKVHGESISTPPVDRLIQNLDPTAVYAWSAKVGGHRYYVVTWKNDDLTLAFDLTSGAWYIWTDVHGHYIPIVSATYDANSKAILQHETNGNLYIFDDQTFQDSGSNFEFSLFTANVDGGLRTQKTCSFVDIVADQIDTDVSVSWSNDDYQTFTTPQTVNLDQERVSVQDGSSFRKRAFNITHSDNTFLRLKALNIMSSVGTF